MIKSLYTDKYEFTMLDSAFLDNTYNTKCVFEVFSKKIAGERPFGVFCGAGRLLEELENFRFTATEIGFLSKFIKSKKCLNFLKNFSFKGNIYGYKEGELYFEYSPVLTIEGTFAECIILETLILSILNYDSAVATAGTRMLHYAGKKPCIEMGTRRTNETAAISASRASYICGFVGTSNLAAGQKYDIPTIGTAAHAWTLLHDNEIDAFKTQVNNLGKNTTLLIDTYDIEQGVKNAIQVGGKNLKAVRIDSGNLEIVSKKVRKLLDKLGAKKTKIVATSDIDEYVLDKLKNCPIDVFGIGTKFVTGSGVPTAEFVYKLVEKNKTPIGKTSVGKYTIPGKKYAYRYLSKSKKAREERLYYKPQKSSNSLRKLQIYYVKNGKIAKKFMGKYGVKNAKKYHAKCIKELTSWNLNKKCKPAIKTATY